MKRSAAILIALACLAASARAGTPALREDPWLVAKKVGAELILLEDDTLRLATDLPRTSAHAFLRLACDARAVFQKQFRVAPRQRLWNGTCTIYLFTDRETYLRFATKVDGITGMENTTAYTRPTRDNPTIAIARDKMSDDEVYRAAIHELGHVFVELYRNDRPLPTWLSEGVAQWFEFRHKASGSRQGRSKELVKTAILAKALPHLEDLFARRVDHDDEVGYAMSWSFTAFLLDAYRNRRFHEFVCSVKDGVSPVAALEKAYGTPLSRLEAQWQLYVQKTY